MTTPIQGNILYYSLPNGTLTPILGANGQYVPASSLPSAIPVNIIATMEPIVAATATTTAARQPAAAVATTAAAQPTPQQQQQQPSCVLMFLQKDGSYGLKRDS